MSKNDDVRSVPRSDARSSLIKCEEFTTTALDALSSQRWNSAGLSAIHAGIAAADTALIASAGLRSASQDHGSVVNLLEHQVPEFTAAQRRQLGGLLKMKNQVAYEQRLLTEIEARQLVDQAKRLARWAVDTVAAHS
ncbi:MAG: HMG-box domain-containing protein [Coriobacteriia bacterium]